MAGLRKLGAPWVARLSKSSDPNVEWDMGFSVFNTKQSNSFCQNNVDVSEKTILFMLALLPWLQSTHLTTQTRIYNVLGCQASNPLDKKRLDDI